MLVRECAKVQLNCPTLFDSKLAREFKRSLCNALRAGSEQVSCFNYANQPLECRYSGDWIKILRADRSHTLGRCATTNRKCGTSGGRLVAELRALFGQ